VNQDEHYFLRTLDNRRKILNKLRLNHGEKVSATYSMRAAFRETMIKQILYPNNHKYLLLSDIVHVYRRTLNSVIF